MNTQKGAQEWEELAVADYEDDCEGGVQYETIEVTCSPKYTVAALKDICRDLKLSCSGKKVDLFDRCRDSEHERVTMKSKEMFQYKRLREAEGNLPKWLLLTGQVTADIAGIDMGTGAQHGHFGPTNKENAVGPPKREYLMDSCFVSE